MSKIAYYRVSTSEQSIESQRKVLGGKFDREFIDEGVSGSIPALNREGFKKLFSYARENDALYVYAVDRLGRDALDIQTTVRKLLEKEVSIHIHGLGEIKQGGVGELILAVLAQIADMERKKIIERTEAGRATAKALLKATGLTQHGKTSLGRPAKANNIEVIEWKKTNKASISETAKHFNLSISTVKRYIKSKIPFKSI